MIIIENDRMTIYDQTRKYIQFCLTLVHVSNKYLGIIVL